MSDGNESEATMIDLTPASVQCSFWPIAKTSREYNGYKEVWRIVLPNGRGIGYIKFSDWDDKWHIFPDGAEKYPMTPDLKDDAAWLLVQFRDKITKKG